MEESNLQLLGTRPGSLVDETYFFAFAFSQCVGNAVFYSESHVVYATAALFEELGYGAVGACRLKQFQLNLTNLQESGFYLLVSYFLYGVAFQTQYVFEIRKGFLNAFYSNAQMFNV